MAMKYPKMSHLIKGHPCFPYSTQYIECEAIKT